MHLKVTNILPDSCTQETSQGTMHYQWIWQTTDMVPDFEHEAFKSTMASLNESRTISIDYINKCVVEFELVYCFHYYAHAYIINIKTSLRK